MDHARNLYNESLKFIGVGGGYPIDYKRARELTHEAALGGFPDAILAMGWFCLNGCGGAKNVSSAKYWYRRSARRGEPMAMYSLGEVAYIEKSYEAAHYWFELARKHGHVRSLYWLGKLYWRGQGVTRDRVKALHLFEQAAHGNAYEAKRLMRFRNRRRYKPDSAQGDAPRAAVAC